MHKTKGRALLSPQPGLGRQALSPERLPYLHYPPNAPNILHREAGEVLERSESGGGAPRLRRSKETLHNIETWAAPSDLHSEATSPAIAVEDISRWNF